MSDGIVTKLEFLLKEGAAIIKEQADEIERLRADRDKWKQLAIADHLDVCKLDDHELCISYLEWKIKRASSGEQTV